MTLLGLCLTAFGAQAQNVPRVMNVEGVLRNVAGESVTGTQAVRFHLFPTANCLGAPQVIDVGSVPVIGGVFSQNMDLTPLGNYFADNAAASLKVEVAGVLFADCRVIGSVAYAFKAEQASTAGNALLLGGKNRAYYESLSGATLPVDDSRLSSKVVLRDDPKTITGVMNFAPGTGSVPFTVDPARNGIVVNLNADRLDGQDGAFYANAGNLGGTLPDSVLSSNVVLLTGAQTFTGTKTFSPTGTVPFAVDAARTGTVTNLNADLLDGQQGAWYQDATNLNAGTLNDARLSTNVAVLNAAQSFTAVKTFNPATGTVPFAVDASRNSTVTNLSADTLDGHDSAYFMTAASSGNFIANGTSVQAGANFNIQGNGVAGGSLTAGTNQYVKVGNAYLSSGGDYVHLSNNEYYNGGAWVATAAGAMLQLTGQTVNFFTHTAEPVGHTQLVTMDAGKMDVKTDVSLSAKHAFRGNDSWLRLNQDGAFTSGVHTPGLLYPGSLYVGGGANPGWGNALVAGKLGVGVTTAGAAIHVSGGGAFFDMGAGSGLSELAVKNNGQPLIGYSAFPWEWSPSVMIQSVNNNRFLWLNAGGDAADYNARIRAGGNGLDFYTGGTNADNGTQVMTLTSGANVGIGTTAPGAKLDVAGMVKVSEYRYSILNMNDTTTPVNGYKIKTNLPWQGGYQMPTIYITGYLYGNAQTVDLKIAWYLYPPDASVAVYNPTASSAGGWAPTIQLARENGKVVILLSPGGYYGKFSVAAVRASMSEVDADFQGWTWADEPITGDRVATVPYVANLGNSVRVDAGGLNVGSLATFAGGVNNTCNLNVTGTTTLTGDLTTGRATLGSSGVLNATSRSILVQPTLVGGVIGYPSSEVPTYLQRVTFRIDSANNWRGSGLPLKLADGTDVVQLLCGDEDCCQYTLGMEDWSGVQPRALRGPYTLCYKGSGATRMWRDSNDTTGVDGNSVTQHISNPGPWNACYFTDSHYLGYVDRGDSALGMELMMWNGYADAGGATLKCFITIED
jgi:hypothetical protein